MALPILDLPILDQFADVLAKLELVDALYVLSKRRFTTHAPSFNVSSKEADALWNQLIVDAALAVGTDRAKQLVWVLGGSDISVDGLLQLFTDACRAVQHRETQKVLDRVSWLPRQ